MREHSEESAVSRVKRSGLDLIPTPTKKKEVATAGFLANVDFEPWPKSDPPDKPGPSAKYMHGLGISARFAAATVQRTKKELIEMHQTIDGESLDELMANMLDASEQFKLLAHVAEVACQRLLIASCANLAAGGPFKGVTSEEILAAKRMEGLA
jgi:hypothetical protein